MQEEMIKHMIKHMIKYMIDSTNWWPEIKSDLKHIVDFSRTFDGMALEIELYAIWLKNYWRYMLTIM